MAGPLILTHTTEKQLRLRYDATNYADFTVSSTGDLTIAPTGGDTSITGTLAVSSTLAVTGAATFSNFLKATGTGLTTSLRLENTTATTGKRWHLYSLDNGTFGLYDDTAGAYALQVSSGRALLIGTTISASTAAGDAVIPNAKWYRSVNALGDNTLPLIQADSSNRTRINANSANLALVNTVLTATAGAISTYLNVNVDGTNYKVALRAVS
jgi:hypothetical protein